MAYDDYGWSQDGAEIGPPAPSAIAEMAKRRDQLLREAARAKRRPEQYSPAVDPMSVEGAPPDQAVMEAVKQRLDAEAEARARPMRAQNDINAARLEGKIQLLDQRKAARQALADRNTRAIQAVGPGGMPPATGTDGKPLSPDEIVSRYKVRDRLQEIPQSSPYAPTTASMRRLLAPQRAPQEALANVEEDSDPARAAAIMDRIKSGVASPMSGGGYASQGSLDKLSERKAAQRQAISAAREARNSSAGEASNVQTLTSMPGFAGMHPDLQSQLFQHAMQQDAMNARTRLQEQAVNARTAEANKIQREGLEVRQRESAAEREQRDAISRREAELRGTQHAESTALQREANDLTNKRLTQAEKDANEARIEANKLRGEAQKTQAEMAKEGISGKSRAAATLAQQHFEENPEADIEKSAAAAGLDENSPEFASLKRRIGSRTSGERAADKYVKGIDVKSEPREIAENLLRLAPHVQKTHLDRLKAAGVNTDEVKHELRNLAERTTPYEYFPPFKIARAEARNWLGLHTPESIERYLPRTAAQKRRYEDAMRIYNLEQ